MRRAPSTRRCRPPRQPIYKPTIRLIGASARDPSANPWALVSSTAMYRALLVNLEGWVKGQRGRWRAAIPPSPTARWQSPRRIGKHWPARLVAAGLRYNGGYNTLSVNDESVSPLVPGDRYYVVPQPTTDAQGNERGGVKMPDIAVPLATFTGYNLRKQGYVAGQQNGLNSSQLAFAVTPSTRKTGDPRKSVQELYGSKASYSTRSTAQLISWSMKASS